MHVFLTASPGHSTSAALARAGAAYWAYHPIVSYPRFLSHRQIIGALKNRAGLGMTTATSDYTKRIVVQWGREWNCSRVAQSWDVIYMRLTWISNEIWRRKSFEYCSTKLDDISIFNSAEEFWHTATRSIHQNQLLPSSENHRNGEDRKKNRSLPSRSNHRMPKASNQSWNAIQSKKSPIFQEIKRHG